MAVAAMLHFEQKTNFNAITGGSFGVVYKGIEKATGETVAIKHVRTLRSPIDKQIVPKPFAKDHIANNKRLSTD